MGLAEDASRLGWKWAYGKQAFQIVAYLRWEAWEASTYECSCLPYADQGFSQDESETFARGGTATVLVGRWIGKSMGSQMMQFGRSFDGGAAVVAIGCLVSTFAGSFGLHPMKWMERKPSRGRGCQAGQPNAQVMPRQGNADAQRLEIKALASEPGRTRASVAVGIHMQER